MCNAAPYGANKGGGRVETTPGASPLTASGVPQTATPSTPTSPTTSTGIDYSVYKPGTSAMDVYRMNPGGLPANWSWDDFTRAQGPGAVNPAHVTPSGDRLVSGTPGPGEQWNPAYPQGGGNPNYGAPVTTPNTRVAPTTPTAPAAPNNPAPPPTDPVPTVTAPDANGAGGSTYQVQAPTAPVITQQPVAPVPEVVDPTLPATPVPVSKGFQMPKIQRPGGNIPPASGNPVVNALMRRYRRPFNV